MGKLPTSNTVKKPKSNARREFLIRGAQTSCAMALIGSGVSMVATANSPAAPQALRPPGAKAEAEFLASCVRCGICVQTCPYDTLKLARWFDAGVATNTPYFVARETPCELCEDIPCVRHCPSGALDQHMQDINEAQMGVAVLIDQVNCLNYKGLRCEVCYRVCPLIDKAIVLEKHHNSRSNTHAEFIPIVNPEHCTGCGKCEHACVLETPAIKVLPHDVAISQVASHDNYLAPINGEQTTLDMLNSGLAL